MKKIVLRAASLTFAVVVTGLLVARAAGCVQPVVEAVPTTAPATLSDAGTASALPVDAGPTLSIVTPSHPEFMPATKAAMPIFREPPPPSAPQQAAPP